MAKPKSLKLRTLVTLRALLKYSDANHRMNSIKLNEHLRPYGLECTSWVLSDTVRVLRKMGIDVRHKGEWDSQGVWIEDRPLPDHELKRLIFAVTTNPHLSKSQVTDILQSLKPFVTVYQENQLQGLVETEVDMDLDDTLYWTYSVIHEAISSGRRVRYSIDYTKYNSESQTVVPCREWATLFTPKCIYQAKGTLYMVGYNNTDRRVDAVNLADIASIKLAFKHKDPKADLVSQWIDGIVPCDVVPGERQEVIYEGPVLFQCRGQYITELYNRFGAPDGPVVKDARCRTAYPVRQAAVTSETLYWLSQIPDYGIRILGPGGLTEAIKDYYAGVSNALLKPIPTNNTVPPRK